MIPCGRPVLALVLAAPSLFAGVEMWTDLLGHKIEAEFLGKSGNYVSFKKSDGSKYLMPLAKLIADDRARVLALTEEGAPHKSAGAVASSPANEPLIGVATPPALTRMATDALAGKLVTVKLGWTGYGFTPFANDGLAQTKFIAFYYSAHWCPPCRLFTPGLVAAYKVIKAAHPEFELIYVSSDKTENEMKTYMRESNMTWPGLRFGLPQTVFPIARPAHESGIPNLVFMTAEGKELATTFSKDGQYDPIRVLAEIKKYFKM